MTFTLLPLYVCAPPGLQSPGTEAGREVRRKCICSLYKSCEPNTWSHPGSLPVPSSLECRKNKDVRLPISHLTTAFGTGKLWEALRLLFIPLSPVFLHILSVSSFPHQLPVPSYNAISSKATMQSEEKCHNELIDQIFLNLFINCVQYLLPFPHKLLHHHFYIWHQAAKTVLIALLLKLWEWFLPLPTV